MQQRAQSYAGVLDRLGAIESVARYRQATSRVERNLGRMTVGLAQRFDSSDEAIVSCAGVSPKPCRASAGASARHLSRRGSGGENVDSEPVIVRMPNQLETPAKPPQTARGSPPACLQSPPVSTSCAAFEAASMASMHPRENAWQQAEAFLQRQQPNVGVQRRVS